MKKIITGVLAAATTIATTGLAISAKSNPETKNIQNVLNDKNQVYTYNDPVVNTTASTDYQEVIKTLTHSTSKQLLRRVKDANYTESSSTKYSQYYDIGFNWFQILGSRVEDENFGQNVIKSIPNGSVLKLGFITATDVKVASQGTGEYRENAIKNQNENSNLVIPAIGGVMPIWSANFTSVGGRVEKTWDSKEAWNQRYHFLDEIRNAGRDFAFSFGGWNHNSIAVDAVKKNYSPSQLSALYEAIIKQFNLHNIDFDIEGTEDAQTDDFQNTESRATGQAAKLLRNEALKILRVKLKAEKYPIRITYTLPTFATGLADDAMPSLEDAFKSKIIDKVNLMTMNMDLKSRSAIKTERTTIPGEMAINTIFAINNLAKIMVDNSHATSIKEAYEHIGFTNLLGINDQRYQIFTPTDMKMMAKFAEVNKINFISNWSWIKDHVYSDFKPNFRPGHKFDPYELKTIFTGAKGRDSDAYNTGYVTKSQAYTNFYKGVIEGTEKNDIDYSKITQILDIAVQRITKFTVKDIVEGGNYLTYPSYTTYGNRLWDAITNAIKTELKLSSLSNEDMYKALQDIYSFEIIKNQEFYIGLHDHNMFHFLDKVPTLNPTVKGIGDSTNPPVTIIDIDKPVSIMLGKRDLKHLPIDGLPKNVNIMNKIKEIGITYRVQGQTRTRTAYYNVVNSPIFGNEFVLDDFDKNLITLSLSLSSSYTGTNHEFTLGFRYFGDTKIEITRIKIDFK